MQNRRTGRTIRMMEKAVKAASGDNGAIVIAANEQEARRLRAMVPSDLPVFVYSVADYRGMDWANMRLRDSHQDWPTFVDHFAIEQHLERRFPRLVRELHRYDKPRGEVR